MNHNHLPAHDPLTEPIEIQAFKGEVREWAERIGVEPIEIHVRPMKRKWASCSSRGRLTFDLDLLWQPSGFRDEVIVHELVHLKVPNHSALFRRLIRAHLGQGSHRSSGATPGTSRAASPTG